METELCYCDHCEKRQYTKTDFCRECHSQLHRRPLTPFEQVVVECLIDSGEVAEDAACDLMTIFVDAISNARVPALRKMLSSVQRAIAIRNAKHA